MAALLHRPHGLSPIQSGQDSSEIMAELLSRSIAYDRAQIFATSMELVQHDEKVDVLTRMERAAMAHVPGFYPGQVVLLVASERVEESGGQTTFGWNAVVGGGLAAHIVPGNHETLFDEQHMPIMARELRTVLHSQ